MTENKKENRENQNCCEDKLHDHDHHHDNDCTCDGGCNDIEIDTMVLSFDGDTEMECGILGIFGIEDQEYIALLDLENQGIMIYRYEETEEDFELDNIQSEEEYDMVVEVFNTLFFPDDSEELIQ